MIIYYIRKYGIPLMPPHIPYDILSPLDHYFFKKYQVINNNPS